MIILDKLIQTLGHRGKTSDGELVYGDYFVHNNKDYICRYYDDNIVEVIHDSVGIYTGCMDIYHNMIFTGDIIQCFNMYNNTKYITNESIVSYTGNFIFGFTLMFNFTDNAVDLDYFEPLCECNSDILVVGHWTDPKYYNLLESVGVNDDT